MKKLMFAIVSLALTSTLFAEEYHYLYWMVDEESQSPEYDFEYVTVSANGNLLTNYKGGSDVGSYILPVDGSLSTTDSYYAYDIAAYVSSTFLFELFDENNNRIAYQSVSGSALAKGGYFGNAMSQVTPFVANDFTSDVPEPTSGLLMLLGLAGLALKRKRA